MKLGVVFILTYVCGLLFFIILSFLHLSIFIRTFVAV